MARKPKQNRALETVSHIKTAGFIAVSRVGMESVTTQLVVDIAGVGIGSFYEYFKNKDDLFDHMQQQFVSDLIQYLKPELLLIIPMEAPQAIKALFDLTGRFMSSQKGVYIRWVQESLLSANHKLDTSMLVSFMSDFALDYLIAHPDLLAIKQLRLLTHLFVSMGVALMLNQFSDPTPKFNYNQVTEGLAYIVESTLIQSKVNGLSL